MELNKTTDGKIVAAALQTADRRFTFYKEHGATDEQAVSAARCDFYTFVAGAQTALLFTLDSDLDEATFREAEKVLNEKYPHPFAELTQAL